MEENVLKYVESWHKTPDNELKPCNDEKFIYDFIEYMKSKDKDHYEFDGDNHYCGNTATLYDQNPNYCMGRTVGFEFAYHDGLVKVFTSAHNGFWTPEYISLKGDDAKPILDVLFIKFKEWGGF